VTREFAPGYRVSAGAHLLYLLDATVRRELDLASHGLKAARSNLKTVALAREGEHLVLDDGRLESGTVSADDRAALPGHHARMLRFARILAKQHGRRPPRILGGGRSDTIAAAMLGLDIRRLGRDDMREFLRIAGINVFDVLEETFDTPLLKGALALDAVLGTNLGPRSNNSVLALLHRLSGQSLDATNRPWLPEGGMGAVTDALAAAARAHGATVRTGSPVTRITLEGDRASGVELASGEVIRAGTVVSNADPARTLLTLLGARHLDTGFAQRIRHLRSRGTAAKLHLALDDLPEFAGCPDARRRAARDCARPRLPRARIRPFQVRRMLAGARARDHDPDRPRPARSRPTAGTCCRPSCSTRRTTRERTPRKRGPRSWNGRSRSSTVIRRICAGASSPPSCCLPFDIEREFGSRAATGITPSSRSTRC
jgi:phytoene dehydrogenase-like protein